MSIGDRIKQERERKGWSQPRLAKECGWTSQSRISQYEANAREPKIADLKKIAKALEISVTDLLEESCSGNIQEPAGEYSTREKKLVEGFRELSEEDRRSIQRQIDALAAEERRKKDLDQDPPPPARSA